MRGGNRSSSGSSAIGLVAAVAVMAVIAVVVLVASGGDRAGPSGPRDSAAGAVQESCRTDYQAVRQAVDGYTAEHGRPPARVSDLTGILRDPVTSPYFTISIGAGGQVEVAAPGHVASAGDANCAYAS